MLLVVFVGGIENFSVSSASIVIGFIVVVELTNGEEFMRNCWSTNDTAFWSSKLKSLGNCNFTAFGEDSLSFLLVLNYSSLIASLIIGVIVMSSTVVVFFIVLMIVINITFSVLILH